MQVGVRGRGERVIRIRQVSVRGGRVHDVTSLCGRPAAEKIGIFCPRAIEFMTSMVEIPVWIISSGYMREYGLIGEPVQGDKRACGDSVQRPLAVNV